MLIGPRSQVLPIQPIGLDRQDHSRVREILVAIPTQFLNDHILSGRQDRFDLQVGEQQAASPCKPQLIVRIVSETKEFDLET